MQASLPQRRVPNVERVRSDVKIAAHQHITIRTALFVKKRAQTLQPVELKAKFVGPQLAPVRYICIDDANAVDGAGDEAFGRVVLVVVKALLNVLDLGFREYRDAVIGFLAK